MTRGHRLAHRLLWPVLALVVATLFVTAIARRPPPDPPQPAPATQEPAK